MPEQVVDALRQAAGEAVPLEQLQAAASRRIAVATATEAGLVTAGASAALTLGAAAIMTGADLGRMEQLPQARNFPHAFVIAREQRSGYDHAVRAAGGRFVEVGFNEVVAGAGVRRTEAWEYEAAFSEQTAGVVYVMGRHAAPPLREVVERAHGAGLPVLVDAAGELPPRGNLRAITATGADLTAFSGGKAIRGPQSTGILCGRRDLISAAALQMLDMDDHFDLWAPPSEFIDKQQLEGLPRHGVGRALKVSKEEIVALLTALELFASGAYDDELPQMRARLEEIAARSADLPITCQIQDAADRQSPPLLLVSIPAQAELSAFEVCRRLRAGAPPIYLGHGALAEGRLVIDPLCLEDEHAAIIAQRLRELLPP